MAKQYAYGVVEGWGESKPTLECVEIVKETPKQVVLANSSSRVSGFRARLRPDEVVRSPREAWERYAKRKGDMVNHLRKALAKEQYRLAVAHEALRIL